MILVTNTPLGLVYIVIINSQYNVLDNSNIISFLGRVSHGSC